jgi:hypothetical protein
MNTIRCKYCGKEFEITDALEHDLVEKAVIREKEKYQKDLEIARNEWEKQAINKIKSDFQYQLQRLEKEKQEEKERNLKLLKELELLTGEIRSLKRKDEERDLEMKKKLSENEEKVREEIRKTISQENNLKDLEKDKKLHDALLQIDTLKAKIQQGSVQTQGEVLELEIENILRNKFPSDEILEVKKGERGADIIQKVIDKRSRNCGMILWETKNAQWSESWINKLKEDQREKKADLAVLVVENMPDKSEIYTYKEGVWITTRKAVTGLALALRFDLVHLYNEKQSHIGKNEKMEILYQYLKSPDFRLKIEAIVDAFTNLQNEQEREKRWFTLKWSRQEKELRKIIDNTYGMYGELQAVTGRELKQIKALDTPENES